MVDNPKQTPNAQVPVIHITRARRTAISEDGKTGMIEFECNAPGGTALVAIAIDVGGLAGVRGIVDAVCRQARSKGLGIGATPLRYPKAFEVGHSDEVRNHVALRFDPNSEFEEMLMLPDPMGVALCDMIEKDIFGRMTPAEQQASLVKRGKSQPIILPPKKKLITPP